MACLIRIFDGRVQASYAEVQDDAKARVANIDSLSQLESAVFYDSNLRILDGKRNIHFTSVQEEQESV